MVLNKVRKGVVRRTAKFSTMAIPEPDKDHMF
jgi:hypothetical protein